MHRLPHLIKNVQFHQGVHKYVGIGFKLRAANGPVAHFGLQSKDEFVFGQVQKEADDRKRDREILLQKQSDILLGIVGFNGNFLQHPHYLVGMLVAPTAVDTGELGNDLIQCLPVSLHSITHNQIFIDLIPLGGDMGAEMIAMILLVNVDNPFVFLHQ